MERVIFSWSSGKDSALALYELRKNKDIQVTALLTTLTEGYDRVSMHGVRRILLQEQAAALGLPLVEIVISQQASNEEYEAKMHAALTAAQAQGVTAVAFGDIFLEDLRQYRQDNLARIGMQAIFPLWKRDTTELIQQMLQAGFKAIVTCVDTRVLGQEFAGREINPEFVAALPPAVDPCGENGEFHTFVFDGPIFHHRIALEPGEKVLRDNRFYFCDLVPDRKPGEKRILER